MEIIQEQAQIGQLGQLIMEQVQLQGVQQMENPGIKLIQNIVHLERTQTEDTSITTDSV